MEYPIDEVPGMRKEIRRLEQLYREVCELPSDGFNRFKEVLGQLNKPILYSFCEQIKLNNSKK